MKKIKHATFRMYFPTLGPSRSSATDSFFCQEVLELVPQGGILYPFFRFERLCVETYCCPSASEAGVPGKDRAREVSLCACKKGPTKQRARCPPFFFKMLGLDAELLLACRAKPQLAGAG